MKRQRVDRRRALEILGAASAALAFGCGSDSPTEASPATGTPTSTNAACAVTPDETAGPFPSRADLFRSDIREDRAGTPLTLNVKVVNVNAGCGGVANANVEIWQCDATGNYSEYGSQSSRNYLRGIQTTNANGDVSFLTIYPGWYPGRATHIHLEVTIGGVSRKVTQIAFPESVSNAVHATAAYGSRGSNPTTNARDGIIADSVAAELVTPVGDPARGYTAAFQVGLNA